MVSNSDISTGYSDIRISGPLGNGVQLTKEQAACVNYKSDKKQLAVKGAAGSGKSLVLMAKAKSYMRSYAPGKKNNIVIFSHTNSLTNYVKEYLDPDGSKSEFITISTLDSYVSDIYDYMKTLNIPNFPIGRPTYNQAIFKDILSEVLKKRSEFVNHRYYRKMNEQVRDKLLNLLADEIHFIAGNGIYIDEPDRYLTIQRKGRGRTGIKREDRREVFAIYTDYVKQLSKKKYMDWDIIYIFIERHKSIIPDSFKFEHVFIDEAQDLSITLMHIAISLMKQDILIAMDANQRIYRDRWTMEELGIPTISRYLKKSFRCTKQIDDFAECLRIHNENTLELDDLSRHVSPEIEGTLPIVINYANIEQEYKYLIRIIELFLKNPDTRTAIIVRFNTEIQKWCEVLSDALIPHVVITGKRNEFKNLFRNGAYTSYSEAGILTPGVKICTIHSAKGLEFHNVIIPHFNDGKYPPSFLIRETEDTSERDDITSLYRNLSYVAMTRARANLIVSFDKYPSLYLEEIDDDLFEYYDLTNDDVISEDELEKSLEPITNLYQTSSEGCTENFGPNSSNVLTESQAKAMSTEELMDYYRGRYEYHKARSERGYSSSMYQIATMLERGIGVEKDVSAALKMYFRAAVDSEEPSIEAQCKLGSSFLTGIPGILNPNIEEAIGWFSTAANSGSVLAMKELVKCYDGTHGYRNQPALKDLLSRLGDNGDAESIKILIDLTFNTDKVAYVHWLSKLAEQGDIDSCYSLGLIYKEGKFVKKDYKTAFDYFSIAAGNGHPLAQCEIALQFFNGLGIDRDFDAGQSWLHEAICQNCPCAYGLLGKCYYMGWGVDIDYDRAKEYIHQSIRLGYEKGSQYFRELYSIQEEREYAEISYGSGLFFDDDSFPVLEHERAKKLFESASKRGSPMAKLNLAKLELGGNKKQFDDIILKNPDHAFVQHILLDVFALLKSSANNNNYDACYIICKLFDMKLFTADNAPLNDYFRYLSMAVNSGIEDAKALYVKWTLNNISELLIDQTAFEYARSLADNNPELTFYLGRCYLEGIGTSVNFEIAMKLFEKASNMGYSSDDYLLSTTYNIDSILISNKNYGYGLTFDNNSDPIKEPDKFFKIFSSSAERNESGAMLNLFKCYFNGVGITGNADKAIFWLLRSMALNNDEAYYVAYLLSRERSYRDLLPSDFSFYFNKAIELGNPAAMNDWAEKNENSNNPKVRVQAFNYYQKAASRDYPPSFYNLGYCYEMGKGVSQNKEMAYRWYKEASKYYDLPKINNGLTRVRSDLIKMGVNVNEC